MAEKAAVPKQVPADGPTFLARKRTNEAAGITEPSIRRVIGSHRKRTCEEVTVRGRVLIFVMAHAALIGGALALLHF